MTFSIYQRSKPANFELDSSDFSIENCIEEALQPLAISAQQKGIKLVWDIAADVPNIVCGDPTRLRQVLINLTGNALKFTGEGDFEVRVTCSNGAAVSVDIHVRLDYQGNLQVEQRHKSGGRGSSIFL